MKDSREGICLSAIYKSYSVGSEGQPQRDLSVRCIKVAILVEVKDSHKGVYLSAILKSL